MPDVPSIHSRKGLSRRRLLVGGVAVTAGALAGLTPRPAAATLQIDVTQGNVQPLPIALPDFVGGGGNDSDIGRNVTQAYKELEWE